MNLPSRIRSGDHCRLVGLDLSAFTIRIFTHVGRTPFLRVFFSFVQILCVGDLNFSGPFFWCNFPGVVSLRLVVCTRSPICGHTIGIYCFNTYPEISFQQFNSRQTSSPFFPVTRHIFELPVRRNSKVQASFSLFGRCISF